MKIFKKLFVVLFVAFATLVVVGCQDFNEPVDLYQEFLEITKTYDQTNIVSDMNLPTSKGDIQITWTSSKPEVVSATGVVNRQSEDVTVRLTAVMKSGELTQNFFFEVTVKAKEMSEDETDKVSDVIAGEDGTNYVLKGTVVAINARSFLLSDGTGAVLVFRGSNWTADVAVGDVITLSGASTSYGNAKQFGTDATYQKVSSGTYTQPAAKELTNDEIVAYASNDSITPLYVKVTGQIAVSGNYFNLNFSGIDAVVGSITYPTDSEALTALDGKTLEILGYVTGLTGTKFLNLMVVSYKEVEGSDEPEPEPQVKTISEIIAGEDGNYETTGKVVAINSRSFLLQDETGAILVFLGSNWTADVAVGDTVKVSGATSVYGGAKQFGAGTTYEKVASGEFTQPAAQELTAAQIDAYAEAESITPLYVKVTGALSVSDKYFNLTVEGATVVGSLTYPTDADGLKALSGKNVEVEGYVTGVSGSTTKYLNLIVVKCSEVGGSTEPEPDVPAEPKTVAEIVAGEDGKYTANGKVIAVYARGFLLQDETGTILVYLGSSWTADVVVGDAVTVTGDTTTHSLSKQFGEGSTYQKGENTNYVQTNPTELTVEQIDAYATATEVTPIYVKVAGTLSVSGYYYNLTIEGATVVGSLAYPADTAALKAVNGRTLEVLGYVIGVSGSTTKYLNIMVVSFVTTDQDPVIPDVTPDPEGNPISLVTKDLGLENGAVFTSWADPSNVVTISADKGSNTNDPKYYDSGTALRVYAGSTLTVKATADLDQVIIVGSFNKLTFESLTVVGGTLELTEDGFKVVANQGVKEVTISSTGTSGHIKYVSIATYTK